MKYTRAGQEYDDTAMPDEVAALRQNQQGRPELGAALEAPRGPSDTPTYITAEPVVKTSSGDPDSLRA